MSAFPEGPQGTDPPATGQSPRKRWVLSAVVIALVAAMAAQLFAKREELDQFLRLSPQILLLLLLLQLASQLLWNAATLVSLQDYVKTLGFWELFMLRMGGFIVGNVVPVAGNFALRMAYLKRQGLSYSDFTWSTILVNVLGLIIGTVLALPCLAVLIVVSGAPSLPVLFLTAGVLAGSIAVLAIARALPRIAEYPWLQQWARFPASGSFAASRRTIARTSGFSLVRHLFSLLVLGVLYQTLSGAPLGVLTGGLVYAITSPIRVVSITPGDNLGLNEWMIASVGRSLSFDVTTGLIVALVYRGVSIASQVVGVLLGGAWLALGAKHDRPEPE